MKITEDYKAYKQSYEMWDEQGRKYNIFKYIKDIINQTFLNLKCKYLGHKWETDCNIGPDSGSESIECTSCGLYYNNIYY